MNYYVVFICIMESSEYGASESAAVDFTVGDIISDNPTVRAAEGSVFDAAAPNS